MVKIRHELRFLLNDQEVCLKDVRAHDTLLDYLRLEQNLRGTKEGCAEGDCGACTVLVGRLAEGELVYETVNACIRFLASVDRCHIVTIEYLTGEASHLHPVQQAMLSQHGSQCGFCTPGIVMSLYALWMKNSKPTDREIETALQGNLCRCTGYQPIFNTAKAAHQYGSPADDRLQTEHEKIKKALLAFEDNTRLELAHDQSLAILPASVDDLAEVLIHQPNATIIAGATDVGLWVTKLMRNISPAVFIAHLDTLKLIERDKKDVTIGANATYSEIEPILAQEFPHLLDFWNRIGGWQVRNQGTIGGNIANGSPIGDTPPVLIALGATLTLRKGNQRRTLPLEDFFIDYGKQDRAQGEFIKAIHIPHLDPQTHYAAYKISKRRDEDISAVCGAFSICVKDNIVRTARIAYGGMAATPKRAKKVEETIIGQTWTPSTIQIAREVFKQDFTPLTDWRASSDYRMLVAQNLLTRFFLETTERDKKSQLSRETAA